MTLHGVKVVEIAQGSVINELLDLPHGARKEKRVVHHDLQILLLGEIDQFLRLGGGVGEGLLDKDVLAFVECLFGELKVGEDRRDDGHRINVRSS